MLLCKTCKKSSMAVTEFMSLRKIKFRGHYLYQLPAVKTVVNTVILLILWMHPYKAYD